MAKTVLTNCFISIAGVDVSNHVSSVEVLFKRAAVDSTNFSGGGNKEAMPGLKSDGFVIDVQQDFAAASINAILQPLYANGTNFVVVVQPAQGAVSVGNPSFTGTVLLTEYQALTGKVGELSTTKVTLNCQNTGIVMATS